MPIAVNYRFFLFSVPAFYLFFKSNCLVYVVKTIHETLISKAAFYKYMNWNRDRFRVHIFYVPNR